MTAPRPRLSVRLAVALVRVFSVLVPGRARRDWRQEWEAEIQHCGDRLAAGDRDNWRDQMDIVARTLGALPDAAWIRRQFTADADLVHDLRHGVRMLRKSPAFTFSAVLILAIGLGGAVSIMTLLDTLFFRPLPYADVERVVTIWQQRAAGDGEREDVAPANFLDWRERATSFSALAGVVPYSHDYTGGGEAELFFGAQVTEGFWDALGMRPAIGRAFLPEEHVRGARKVVILSDGLWRRRFGADASIVNKPISLDGEPYTVVGVLPREFAPQILGGPGARDVWTPKVIMDHEKRTRGSAWWNVIGRLEPGVSREAAQRELDTISAALADQYRSTNQGVSAAIVPLREHLMGNVRTPLVIMLGAVILVLGIGCANVASLLLARGRSREREFAIRAALGAGRARLVRQLVSESLLLSFVAGAAGVVLARWGIAAIVALAPAGLLRLQDAAIDRRSLAMAAILTTVTALAFGLLPALQFSRGGTGALRERTGGRPRRAFRHGLVGVEVAFALVLLAGAGLLIRSFERLTSVNPGFSAENVAELQVFVYERHATDELGRLFFNATIDRMRALPDVLEVGAVSAMPFAAANIDIKSPLEVVGRAVNAADRRGSYVTIATPGYFPAMTIPLGAGRFFAASDDERAPRVAIISDSLARREWPGESPIGKRLAVQWHGQRVESEVVGVVAEIRHDGLDRVARPEVFMPFAQEPFGSMTYVIKTRRENRTIIDAAKREVWAVDPLQTFYDTARLDRLVAASVVHQRFSMTLMTSLALVALVLCATGIYAVVSFTTSQRTREIGVRMALGADGRQIRRMVIREGTVVIGAGLAAGLAGAFALSRFLQRLLFEVQPGDPATMMAVLAILGAVGLAACYLPARRATRVDPVVALRID